jgi:hypothetical protein
LVGSLLPVFEDNTRWFKYDRDKLWLVYTQIVPVIFEPPCILVLSLIRVKQFKNSCGLLHSWTWDQHIDLAHQ